MFCADAPFPALAPHGAAEIDQPADIDSILCILVHQCPNMDVQNIQDRGFHGRCSLTREDVELLLT